MSSKDNALNRFLTLHCINTLEEKEGARENYISIHGQNFRTLSMNRLQKRHVTAIGLLQMKKIFL